MIAGDGTPAWVRWWFRAAAVYGLLALAPLLLAETSILGGGEPRSDPVSHHGFVGTALAFQLAYWTIGGDPARFRRFMPVAVVAKLGFLVPVAILFAQGRASPLTLFFAGIDGVLACGFAAAWRATRA